MEITEIKNAIISSAIITSADHNLLSAWVQLDYGGMGQGFGGYALYVPKSFTHHKGQANYAGHFIFRCMQIAGVTDWSKMKGMSVRAKIRKGSVISIGHIINDDWFTPSEDFEAMQSLIDI